MKVGLIARAEDRGLGNLTREFARHIRPDRTLIVRPQAASDAGLAFHLDWFDDDALVLHWQPNEAKPHTSGLPRPELRAWLDGLDVVYAAESLYDWRLAEWARQQDVRTVVHAMPEYFKHAPNRHNRFPADLPGPDVWWVPTGWRTDLLGDWPFRQVEVPVPADRWDPKPRPGGPARWLHVGGAMAQGDRNGTRLFLEALRLVHADHEVTIAAQTGPAYTNGGLGRNVRLRTVGEVADYWRLYDGHDALVLPRRYGGLSLPALEAFGAGLAVLMPDVEPQRSEWPARLIPAQQDGHLTTSAGRIPLYSLDPRALAREMDWISKHASCLHEERRIARQWAVTHSWERLRPAILAELELAAERGPAAASPSG